MRTNTEINNEILKNRLQELCGNLKSNNSEKSSNLEYSVKATNNVNYGILREGTHYFIKDSSKSNGLLTESDFDYIGGLRHKNDYRYNSYSDALKNLNMLFNTMNESFIQEEDPIQEPQPEAQPEAQPADSLPDASITDDPDESFKNIDHFLGKLTYEIRNTPEDKFSDEKVKAIMNSLVSALPLSLMSPKDRLELAKRVNKGGEDEDDEVSDAPVDGLDQLPAPAADEPMPESEPEPIRESKIDFLTSHILSQLKK